MLSNQVRKYNRKQWKHQLMREDYASVGTADANMNTTSESFAQPLEKCATNAINHLAIMCRSKQVKRSVKAIDDSEEIYQTQVSEISIDDSQLVTLKLESGNYLCFQVDTGAQCNVVPLEKPQRTTS